MYDGHGRWRSENTRGASYARVHSRYISTQEDAELPRNKYDYKRYHLRPRVTPVTLVYLHDEEDSNINCFCLTFGKFFCALPNRQLGTLCHSKPHFCTWRSVCRRYTLLHIGRMFDFAFRLCGLPCALVSWCSGIVWIVASHVKLHLARHLVICSLVFQVARMSNTFHHNRSESHQGHHIRWVYNKCSSDAENKLNKSTCDREHTPCT